MINERIEKIKTHVKKHKEAYLVGTGSLVLAGITALIMRSNAHSEVWFSNRRWGRSGFPTEPKASVPSPNQAFCGRLYDQRGGADVYTTKPQMNIGSNFISNSTVHGDVTTNVARKGLSYITSLDGTDRWWISQADTARTLGESEANISKHINHGAPLKTGLSLTRRGVAA